MKRRNLLGGLLISATAVVATVDPTASHELRASATERPTADVTNQMVARFVLNGLSSTRISFDPRVSDADTVFFLHAVLVNRGVDVSYVQILVDRYILDGNVLSGKTIRIVPRTPLVVDDVTDVLNIGEEPIDIEITYRVRWDA